MYEACQTALGRAFGAMGLASFHAGVWADNVASPGLLRNLGFTITSDHQRTPPDSALAPKPKPKPKL